MTDRLRTIAAVAFVVLFFVGGWFVYRVAVNDNAQRAGVMAQSVATSTTDAEVCSHVSPAPYLMTPGGDWKTPTVAALAADASPLVRDAYFTAASMPLPDSYHWAETLPPYKRAMSQLASVCTAVRARP